MMCGGTSDARELVKEETDLVHLVKPQVEAKAGSGPFQRYEPISVKSQVVAGTNMFVKILVSADTCVHARIFCPLPGQGETEVHSVKAGLPHGEAIEYF